MNVQRGGTRTTEWFYIIIPHWNEWQCNKDNIPFPFKINIDFALPLFCLLLWLNAHMGGYNYEHGDMPEINVFYIKIIFVYYPIQSNSLLGFRYAYFEKSICLCYNI